MRKRSTAHCARVVAGALGAAFLVLIASGCGYFHTADIAGYVVDSDTDEGVNGATVTFYMADPTANENEEAVTATETNTSNGNPGYFSQKVIWENSLPRFGQEGDSGTVYVRVAHPDYQEIVTPIQGILSDTLNFVSNIEIDTAIFSVAEVTGRVVGGDGLPVNGVQVVLSLTYDNEEEEAREYADNSGTIEEDDGRFVITDVEWRDTSPDASDDGTTATAALTIDDPDYRLADGDSVSVELTSGEDLELADDVEARQTTFTAESLTGRVIRDGTSEGVNGVRIVLNLDSTTDEDEDYVATTATIDGVVGSFEFNNVTWEDEDPDGPTSDTETGEVFVDDADFYWAADSDNDPPLTRAVSLVSDQSTELSSAIAVNRFPRTEFSAQLDGRVVERTSGADGTSDSGVPGVTVTLSFVDEDGAGGTVTRTLTATTNPNGDFNFFVEWTDSTSRDADDAASDAGGGETDIPEGEDIMQVDIAYDVSGTTFDAAAPNLTDFEVKSWQTPNFLPTAVDPD